MLQLVGWIAVLLLFAASFDTAARHHARAHATLAAVCTALAFAALLAAYEHLGA